MAYGTSLASVHTSAIDRYRRGEKPESLGASKIVVCSHLIGYWVKLQPLGRLLGESIDQGETLSDNAWHPLRPPVVVSPGLVRKRAERLRSEWNQVRDQFGPTDGEADWYAVEILKVLTLYEHASGAGEAVVSVLDAPFDDERASRTTLPKLADDFAFPERPRLLCQASPRPSCGLRGPPLAFSVQRSFD